MSTLVVVPARGGSKGVSRKNMQLLDGVPLVIRAAQEASKMAGAVKVVVSSEDPEILAACHLRGVDALLRPKELAADDVPLAPVIAHAAKAFSDQHDPVLVLQPTTILPAADLDEVVRQFRLARAQGVDVAFCTVRDAHVYWQDGRRLTPYLQRQELAGLDSCPAREVGVRVMTREYALSGAGVEGTLELDQAPDVDTYDDLADLERRARRAWVELAFLADPLYGTGHVFRCLRLADRLRRDHHVTVNTLGHHADWLAKLFKQHDLAASPVNSRVPDLLVLDALDLHDSRIVGMLQHEVPTVVFESQSEAALTYGAAVFDELRAPARGSYFGPRYAVLREEFVALPSREYREKVGRVLVSFGGSDPAGLGNRVAELIPDDLEVRLVQGPAAEPASSRDNVTVVTGAHMAQEMWEADLLVTSKGRTQHEAAATGVPTITLAANAREQRHNELPGHLHLGLHAAVSDGIIWAAIRQAAKSPDLREEMGTTARAQVDGKGVERICHVINGILRGL